jgi:hypothetical protein
METWMRYRVNRGVDVSALNVTNVGKSSFALWSLILQIRETFPKLTHLPATQISHLRLQSQKYDIHMNQTGYTIGAIII